MRDFASPLLFAAALILFTACGEPRLSNAAGPRDYLASDYEDVLSKWTRSGGLLDFGDAEDHLTVTATYQAWDFRWAYDERYADDFRLTAEQKSARREESAKDDALNYRFYIAMYGSKPRWGKIGTRDAAWVVRLVDDKGNESEAAEIVEVPRPGALETRYFPYTTPWRNVFQVRFSRQKADGSPAIHPSAAWMGLRFAGPQGHRDVKWLLRAR